MILDLPVTLSLGTLIAGHALPYAWNLGHPARVGLMPRGGTQADIVWCEVDPAYVFHVVNAFDLADGRVALDVCAYPTMFAGEPGGPDARSRGLERWTVDPAARSVAVATLDPAPQEFPRVDERRFGQPYRYAYAMALGDGAEFRSSGRLYKHDLAGGTRETHLFGPDRHPGEFVFVPAHAAAEEDEGWLVGLVIDAAADVTELVMLDARAFALPPAARIRLPHRVPPGFHGNWLPRRTA